MKVLMQISKISLLDPSYPKYLRHIESPPKDLYVRGIIPTEPMIAVIGTRRPSQYGRDVTYRLAADLARAGLVVVSGLAYGLDAVAHRAALDVGGKTVAVLANGLDTVYPLPHGALAAEIIDNGGAVVSEQIEGTPPLPQHFVARNRIVSGLCRAVLVTEATAKSGTLITATFASNQNRLVMAIPGNITSERAAGPNNLIKSGALAVTDVVDVLTALDFDSGAVAATPVRAASASEAKILDLLSRGINATQELIAQSGYSASEFANIVSLMEITGKLTNLGAGHWGVRGRT